MFYHNTLVTIELQDVINMQNRNKFCFHHKKINNLIAFF